MTRFAALAGLAVAGLLAGAGCGGMQPVAHTRTLFAADVPPGVQPYLGMPLQTGQILLTESPGPYALLFVLSQKEYVPLTHAGIIVVDKVTGEPWVYEMAAEFHPVFASTMEEALEDGGMKRTPFFDYVSHAVYSEVVDLDTPFDREKLGATVLKMYEDEVAFDPHWDFQDRKALYCTEFVGVAFESVGVPMPPLVDANPNPSMDAFLDWFGVHSRKGLPGGAFARNTHTVAVLGLWKNRAGAMAHFEAKRELHRRFTVDQRLGNLLALDGMELVIRPEVEAFLNAAPTLYAQAARGDVPPADEVRQKVRALADEILGPFAEAPAPATPAASAAR